MGTAKSKGKVVIIGAGFVGATAAYSLTMSGLCSELVLVDVFKEKAMGEAMDLNHGLCFMGQMSITAGDYSDVKDADIIIITAGAARKPGETRLDLAKKNVSIIKDMVPKIMEHYNGGVILVVSNPVDVLTYMVQKLSGLPVGKVIGSGTVLDSARFRYQISTHTGVDVKNIHGYIIGEHGDSEVPAWSVTHIAGRRMADDNTINKEQIFQEVRDAGANIIKYKGATYYGIATSITRICEAILKDQNSILTVGSVIDGHYGINDVALSVPSVVNREGIAKLYDVNLSDEDLTGLQKSAAKIKEVLDQVK
ncbi:MAG: L-lactate dehydrogenase [Clostridia bacterium]|nr:L-lactate dehydrogenase [Clostridia bacterium]